MAADAHVAAHPSLTLALALGAGVLAQSIARHARIPGIILLLLAGVALGPDGLGWVQPRDLGEGLFALVEFAVAVILFEGGLNLQISRLRREQSAIQRLVTLGALVTFALASLAPYLILGWALEPSLLFGSLVVVTGPTVIGPLVSELRLKPRVATVLSAEGVLIDPVGAILAVLVLELVLTPDAVAAGARDLALRIGFGALMGVVVGYAIGFALRARKLVPEGFENIFVLAAVLVLATLCDAFISQSGILAVTIAGVVVGNLRSRVDRDLREFKDQLTLLLIGLIFVMLAADVRADHVLALGWPGVAVVAVLIFVVRPITVWLSTISSDLSWRERTFVAWIAPRGIVAAAVASLVAQSLESHEMTGGVELRALVFLTIAGTVILAGLTAAPVATLLGVRLRARDTTVILGAYGLGLALARVLRDAGKAVVFIDSNSQSVRRVQEEGFSVVFGNALDERTLQRARMLEAEAVVAVTANQTVNGVFVSRARELFGVPRGYLAATRADSGLAGELVEHGEARALFEGVHDVERWEVRERHGGLELVQAVFEGVPETPEPDGEAPVEERSDGTAPFRAIGERVIILAVARGGKIQPMDRTFTPQAGDRGHIVIHVPEREDALEMVARVGWRVLSAEELEAEAGEDASAPDASEGSAGPAAAPELA